jgi:predicted nucleic acid-binding protein
LGLGALGVLQISKARSLNSKRTFQILRRFKDQVLWGFRVDAGQP